MILTCNYEEVNALRTGARAVLDARPPEPCAVAAPDQDRAPVQALMDRLEGDLEVQTLEEQRGLQATLDMIVACLRAEMDAVVVATHPAAEGAVAAYFDYAHAVAVRSRLAEMGDEMRAIIELMTGEPVDDTSAATVLFPD